MANVGEHRANIDRSKRGERTVDGKSCTTKHTWSLDPRAPHLTLVGKNFHPSKEVEWLASCTGTQGLRKQHWKGGAGAHVATSCPVYAPRWGFLPTTVPAEGLQIFSSLFQKYIHTYMHTYIHTYIHTYTPIHPYIHKYMHTYIHRYIHT